MNVVTICDRLVFLDVKVWTVKLNILDVTCVSQTVYVGTLQIFIVWIFGFVGFQL